MQSSGKSLRLAAEERSEATRLGHSAQGDRHLQALACHLLDGQEAIEDIDSEKEGLMAQLEFEMNL